MPTDLNASSSTISADLQAQRAYAQKVEADGFDFSLTIAGAFIRGIRDLGYKHTGTALDELIDNAIQAEARNIHVVFGYDGSSAKPTKIAVIDDGHGMDPDMTRLAAVWGGTHRENDRTGFGRYGYGLPSACVSQGHSFTIYSCTLNGAWHAVTIDLDRISRNDPDYIQDGKIVVPQSTPRNVPGWVADHIDTYIEGGLPFGSVVVIEQLDRLDWKTVDALERHLLQHFGVTYRNFLRSVVIQVNATKVEAVDPLFLTPGARFYDDPNGVYAQGRDPLVISVKDKDKDKDKLTVRFSYMPARFQLVDELTRKLNARFPIMKEHNGIIVLRDGRQIDVVTKCPWTVFQNPDWNWKVEINFPPSLDEEFSITTSKQQVVLSERIWEILREQGVYNVIQGMRHDLDVERAAIRTLRDEAKNAPRPSETAMDQSAKFQPRPPSGDPLQRRQENEQDLKKEVERRAKESGLPPTVVERELRAEIATRPYRLEEEDLPGAPFYRVAQPGGQKVLYLNKAHRFYTDVYAGPDSTPRVRAALEIVLFVLGECEIDSIGDRRLFYQTERGFWSMRLLQALDQLNKVDDIRDALAASEVDQVS